ncbi:MAG: serine/threonine protein kinase, partial [Acidobacteria bacterium]|nr:serine/threonine protein kinase [Acidobacteriota bacterium]
MAGYDITSPFQEGVLVGRYQLLGSIGRGGMGEVWKALDTSLARVVALKVFPVGLAATPQRRARFEREARAAAAVSHPNLVGIFDVGEFEGLPYLVQEFVDGETIEAMLDRAPVPVRRAVAWAIQAAEGLAHAHDAGILHRDIKPGNLMVGRDGRVRVLDFGLAKLQDPPEDRTEKDGVREENLTTEGLVLGTAHYMSPEQAMGRKLDGRSDVFSLGICLFEMIAGERPFQGASAIDVMHAIISKPAKTLPATVRSVPPALHGVLDKALQKDPANRYAGMRELVRALAQVLQEAPDSDPLGDALTPSLGAPVVP